MGARLTLCFFRVAIVLLGFQIASMAAISAGHADELAAAQLITPADMTPVELDYYNKAADLQVKKNFIITRSYVRLAQKVVAKTLAVDAFPMVKPNGFSVQYLLPDDPPVINQALGLALAARMKKCLEIKAPGCR